MGTPQLQSDLAAWTDSGAQQFAPGAGHDGPNDGAPDPPVRVEVQDLRDLQREQVTISSYVRVAFQAQRRLTGAVRALGWLTECRLVPDKLSNDDYLTRGDDLFTALETNVLSALGACEPDVTQCGQGVDAELATSIDLFHTMQDPTPGADPAAVAKRLDGRLREMVKLSEQLVRMCETKLGSPLNTVEVTIKRLLTDGAVGRATLAAVPNRQPTEQAGSAGGLRPFDAESVTPAASHEVLRPPEANVESTPAPRLSLAPESSPPVGAESQNTVSFL